MKDSYLAECLEKFHDLPDQLQEMIGGFDACFKIKQIEDAYGVSLSFATILIAIGELTIDDLTEYLNLKFNLDKTKGDEITDKLGKEIFDPALELIIKSIPSETDLAAKSNKLGSITELSTTDKKELILKTFEGEIVQALRAEPAKLQDFNIIIFQAISADDNLDDEMERLLYINQEKLSDHHIVLDGHPASPTIANWLKDFIKRYGTDIFNEVTLAEYLSESPNIKQIRPGEKELVRKVLKLYRNLVFFPDSMDGVPTEHWEIFPIDRVRSDSIRDVLTETNSTDLSGTRKTVTPAVTESHVPVPAPIPATPVTESPELTERQKTIFDLQKTLSKYSSTSLEYKAIHQEINRLSHK